jgi:PAS domain-containing protein
MKPDTKKEARTIKKEAQNFALFIFSNPNPILQFTEKGVLLSSNKAGKDFLELCGDDAEKALAQDAVRLEKQTDGKDRKERPNIIEKECGQKIYSFTVIPVRKTHCVNLYGEDITEQKKAERVLAEQESKLKKDQARVRRHEDYRRSLFSQMTEGFALYEMIEDKNGIPVDYRFLEVNDAYEKLTGLRREHIIRKLRSSIAGGRNKWSSRS